MSTVITHKQFANEHTWSMDLCGRPLTVNMGKVAELATASALVTYGETTVLVATTVSPVKCLPPSPGRHRLLPLVRGL